MPTPRRDSLHSGLVDTATSARPLEPRAAPRPRPPADAQEMGAKWTISYSRPAHLHIGGAAPPKRPPEKTGGLTYRSLPGFSSRQVLASILFPTAKRQEARPRDGRSTEPVGPSQPRAGAVRVPLVDRLPAAGLTPWRAPPPRLPAAVHPQGPGRGCGVHGHRLCQASGQVSAIGASLTDLSRSTGRRPQVSPYLPLVTPLRCKARWARVLPLEALSPAQGSRVVSLQPGPSVLPPNNPSVSLTVPVSRGHRFVQAAE